MPNFTAGTSFTDGVTNDVTAAKLNALIADAVPTSSLSLNSTTGTIANFTSSTANVTNGTITNLTNGTTTGTAATFTTGTLTTGVIPTLTSTTLITSGTGTAASPAIQPTGDTNTGIFFPAADTIAFSEGGTEAMRIDSSGNVGIGASSPSQKLDVNGGSAIRGTIFIGDGSSSVIRKLTANTPLNFANSGGNTEMTIDSSGNVGIGITSPANRLHIIGTTAQTQSVSIGAGGNAPVQIALENGYGARQGIVFQNNGSASYQSFGIISENTALAIKTASYNIGSTSDLNTNWTERLRIDSSGNVGVGTASMTGRLNVNGATATSSSFSVYITNSAGSQEFFIRDDGLIGTGLLANSPYNFTTANAANCNISVNGYLARSTSSIKYKKDISNLTHGLTEVLKLRPVTYKGKSEYDGGKIFGGLIAEEVHDAGLTEFVQYTEDGSPDSLSYGNMVALAFKAIQELKAENDSLRSRIEALEAA